MRAVWTVGFAALVLTGCTSSGGTAPLPRAGGREASIDLTVSGGLTGTAKQISKAQCPNLGSRLIPYTVKMDTALNGKTYHVALMINTYKGPLTVTLPGTNPARISITIDEQGGTEGSWHRGDATTGTVTVNSDESSGTVDVKGMPGSSKTGQPKPVDLRMTYFCPVSR
jgi:hypothetical protein